MSENTNLCAGSIKRVKLINFMCHSELTVDFGSQVSFVTGHNGSGKSAVLAGIVAGFGARAGATARGTKLGDLIKHGQRSASVIIHLQNAGAGPKPFAPDIYGHTIIIERTFHLDKSGAYKICSASGKVISKKRADLDAILQHYNIQVNNPVFLMNQDTCRSFLNSKTGKELYSFFYKAPLLDEMEESVQTVERQASETKITVTQKEQEMEPIRAAITEWEGKLSKCHRPEDLQTNIKKVKAKIKIGQYQILEKQTASAKSLLATAQSNLQTHEASLQKSRDRIPEFKNQLEELKTRREELTPAMQESQQILDTNKPQMKQLKETTQTAKTKLEDAKAELAEKKRNLRTFETELQRSKQRQDLDDFDQKKADLESEIKQLNDNLGQGQSERKTIFDERIAINTEVGRAKNALDENTSALTALQRHVSELDREIQSFTTTANDSWGILKRMDPRNDFATKQKQLMDGLMKQPGVLKGKIIGPCVLELNLKDDIYGKVVEKVVGPYFRTYLIEDERDRQRITEEFRKVRLPAPPLDCVGGAFMTSEMPFDDACRSAHPTVADVVSFKHPHVRNVILDALGLHQILVMPTTELARQYYRSGPRVAGCRMVYDLQANQHSDQDGYMFVPSSDYENRLLCKDVGTEIDSKTMLRNQKSAELEERKRRQAELSAEVKKRERELMNKTRQLKEYDDNDARNQNRLTALTVELEAVKIAQPTDIQVMLDEVEELKLAAEEAETRVTQLEVELETAKARENKASERFREMKNTAEEEVKELDEIVGKYERLERKIEGMESDIRTSQRQSASLEKIIEEKKQQVAAALQLQEDKKRETLEFGIHERYLSKQVSSEEELEGELANLEQLLRNVDSNVENSYDYCAQKLKELNDSKEIVDHQLRTATKAVILMMKNATQRQKNYVLARHKASGVIKELFAKIMSERGFEGDIELDHEARNLKFLVKPHPESQCVESNVKSLSGGERSFTMVSFLLALWQLIEIPFRVLDEFDVFMDMLNRDYAMLRLIDAAVNSGRQFIFLTPLSFSQSVLDTFKESSQVEVIRMPTVARPPVGAGE
ncbi:structural maintenance of chromosomes protein 6-like [Paramacrobiotus metropolitanus]|uniref:structural maintenance of chromosomes protein 6-like n=1 Tax=Paramacrobiotus metropolitanus TaxID=2943436 RepID=UPI0024465015|nr:structural maintenance of chromosomes protein 6-like [Paramacrobiotus metropolitanus]